MSFDKELAQSYFLLTFGHVMPGSKPDMAPNVILQKVMTLKSKGHLSKWIALFNYLMKET